MMGYKENAAALTKKDFYVFPIVADAKNPLVAFKEKATRDASAFNFNSECNVGVFTERFKEAEALIVVDIDKKDERDGFKSLKALELIEDKTLTKSFTVETPSGGLHVYYKWKEPVKGGTNVLGLGLDIRSRGGYVVGPGSSIGGRKYRVVHDVPIAEAPLWVVEMCGRQKDPELDRKEELTVEINKEAALSRSILWLSEQPEVEPGERNNQGYIVACKLRDFGLDKPETALAMSSHWKCNPMLDIDELTHVVNSAFNYALNKRGSEAPEVIFGKVEKDPNEPQTEMYLDRLNKEFALVFGSETHSILHQKKDAYDQPVRLFISELTFKRMFSDKTVAVGKSVKSWAEVWLNWPGRRRYEGMVFAPEKDLGPTFLNTWQGFTVKPVAYEAASKEARAGFDAFLEHALNNVCAGDTKLFTWLMTYFAHMVQKPYERPLTTLVLKGEKGTGKNVIVDRVGFLFGREHYKVTGDSRYLTSNFNGHLESCLCLVLDEAFWSGDKAAEGKLKVLTTSPEILIERKGREAYTIDNLVRLVVIGNEEWLVPASADERRYAVFNVSDGRRQDNSFFHSMRVNMDEKGGASILLDYLKKFDLTQADINIIPKTEGLTEQILLSLKPLDEWWYECLFTGRIIGAPTEIWYEQTEKGIIREAFKRYCFQRNVRSRLPHDAEIGRFLHKACTGIKSFKKRGDSTPWQYMYEFPKLEIARSEFEKHLRRTIDWSKHREETRE